MEFVILGFGPGTESPLVSPMSSQHIKDGLDYQL
jgi:hypothetical protein